MLIVFYLLLMLRLGRCEDDLIFETNTVVVGEDVALNCTRLETDYEATLFWIRLVSGKPPDVLGGTFAFDYISVKETSHITAKQEPGTYVLQISHAKLNDTGLYYCIKVDQLNMIFRKGVFLRIKGTEPAVTAVIQEPLSDSVRPGSSVTLQCSVFADSDNRTCPVGHSVYWFRTRSDGSYPTVMYAHGNSGDECERSPDTRPPPTCVQSFSKNVSLSDAGTYHCAVATCGHILFGKGTKLDVKELWFMQTTNIVQLVLSAALAISLTVIVFLLINIKKKSCKKCTAAVAQQTADTATVSGEQRSQQRDVDSLAYSAPSFTKKTTNKTGRGNPKGKQTVYTGVIAFEMG